MYIPKHFEVTDKDTIFKFIEENAFGQLISQVDGKLFSTHLPWLLSDDKTQLFTHMAIQNPQHLELTDQDVLITFEGPHHYISPTWLNSAGVPTWNYQAVHLYGRATVINDKDKLEHVLQRQTMKYEATRSNPWQPDYKQSLLNVIVAIEVTIDDIQCKYKLSQNRSTQDKQGIFDALRA
jgi:transcriptional regulator